MEGGMYISSVSQNTAKFIIKTKQTMKQKLLIVLLLLSSVTVAQDIDKQALIRAYKKLDNVDLKSFRSEHFLNKGFFFGQGLEPYRKFKENPEHSNFVFLSPFQWQSIDRGIRKSGIKSKAQQRSPDVQSIIDRYQNQENVVPIGIIQAEGEWLEKYEIEENIKAKRKGYALSKAYRKFDVFNGSVLKQKVYSGTVTFEIVAELFDIRGKGRIKSISIDLADGRDFREVQAGDRITASYNAIGEKAIAVKFELPNNEFISYSVINVVTLEKEQPDLVFELGGSSANGRTSGLNGGRAELFNGCDRVFDRPVIIVEGFDPTNQINIADKRDNFRRADIEESFQSSGFDVIYLDFSNGGADIRNNARVLQDLIIDVNAQKTGNFPLTIIGESMGGLVARWALTDMERRSRTHNVSHFISFDSPHLGANVPVGFQKLMEDINDVDIRDLFNIGQGAINEAFTMLNSRAARQMLLRYKGPNPHPDFTTLQNEFNTLGFPQQNNIRNISIVNGSALGTRQEPVNNYDPDDIIFKVDWVSGLMSSFIKVRTNQINGNGKVSSLWILTGTIPTTIKEKSYNFNAFNFDIAAGGFDTNRGAGDISFGWWINLINVSEWFGNTFNDFGRERFSFVPLFSSVASTAPRTNQNDLNRPVNQLINNNWTPFDAVYAGNNNTFHVDAFDIRANWINLIQTEYNIPFTTFCQEAQGTNPAAPVPFFFLDNYYMCEYASKQVVVSNPSPFSNLYRHTYTITGPTFRSGSGSTFTIPSGMPPGTYTITVTRAYNNASGVAGPSSSYSRVFTVYPFNHPTYGCNTGGGGDLPINVRVSDWAESDTSAINPIKNISTYPNPVKGELNLIYEMVEDGDISIRLVPLIQYNQSEIIITDSFRPVGQYLETYHTDYLQNGLYLLIIQANNRKRERKVIINK